jgi:hypothetical protein
MQPYPQPA